MTQLAGLLTYFYMVLGFFVEIWIFVLFFGGLVIAWTLVAIRAFDTCLARCLLRVVARESGGARKSMPPYGSVRRKEAI